MLIQEFIRKLKAAKNQKVADNERLLGRGGAASFDEYKRIVGKNQGLHELDEIINEVFNKEQDDE